ncbi:MAG: lipocalin-like domain-containing protein, partial [Bryobacteraceae bacterium]
FRTAMPQITNQSPRRKFVACPHFRLAALFLCSALSLSAQQWQRALPGYQYQFPRDSFSHPNYRTEWWYYTGNLRAADGRRFGFELTFFRRGEHVRISHSAVWKPSEIYLAHLALSDIDGHKFYYTERLNRAGPGLAGISLKDRRYWNGNWQVRWLSLNTGEQELQAVSKRFSLKLNLKPEKPFIINGENGVSRKGPLPGEASHYISCTRLGTTGQLTYQDETFRVTGLAWMDHEFFTSQLDPSIAGWDWFAIQLSNDEELMLYRLRKRSGGVSRYSSGTFVDRQGKAHFLSAAKIQLSPLMKWHDYPVAWRIVIPSLGIDLTETPDLNDQELIDRNGISPTYWEGAVTYTGRVSSGPVHGVGYLELTGYSGAVTLQ